MVLKARLFSVVVLLVASACASSGSAMNLASATASCENNRSAAHHVEVYIPNARVVRVLGMRRSYSGDHEGFIIAEQQQQIKVEDNVDITGPIALRPGDAVSLLGQYECDDNVIHWTHRDPRGRHIAGYIEVNGQRYQ